MWNDILNRIRRLQALDRNCAIFGADSHRYRFLDTITPDNLARTEARLGVSLPDELRKFYTELGDGGCGPDWGLYRSDQLDGFNADHEWPGIEALEDAKCSAHILAGVVAVMDRYYNFRSLIVCTGSMRGQVIAFEEGQFAFVEAQSLIDVYRKWLEQEEGMLDGCIDLMRPTRKRRVGARGATCGTSCTRRSSPGSTRRLRPACCLSSRRPTDRRPARVGLAPAASLSLPHPRDAMAVAACRGCAAAP